MVWLFQLSPGEVGGADGVLEVAGEEYQTPLGLPGGPAARCGEPGTDPDPPGCLAPCCTWLRGGAGVTLITPTQMEVAGELRAQAERAERDLDAAQGRPGG